jgi:iron(III) transport system permease protein
MAGSPAPLEPKEAPAAWTRRAWSEPTLPWRRRNAASRGSGPPRNYAARRSGVTHPRATALATLVTLFALLPLGFVIAVTIGVGWDTAVAMIFRPRVGELLVNTVVLELLAVTASLVLAVALAWLTERTDLPGARIWAWLMVAPLAVPAFVQSYAWSGVVPGIHGLGPAVMISVLAYFPFVYLPVAAQLRRLDPAIEDTAASLGLAPTRVFFSAVLPQLRLAIAGGGLLVGLHLLSEYGLYGLIRFDTFTTAIIDQYQSSYAGPAANMLAVVLVVCCLVLLGGESLLRGGARYARVGSGAPRALRPRRLGQWRWPALLLLLATTLLALGVPLMTIGGWLMHGGLAVWDTAALGNALGQSVGLSVAGAALTTLVAMPMAWLAVRSRTRLTRALEAGHYYVGALPGVVVALALVTVTVHALRPLYETAATLLAAYVLLFLPLALTALRASIAQAPVELEWAAMALGRTAGGAARLTMRLAMPGVAVSAVLVGLGVATELTATLLLAPSGTATLATKFWSLTSELDYPAAAPYALLMIAASLPLTLVLTAQSRRLGGR